MDRVAITIGPISIYWYSIMIVLGILFAMFLVFREVKRQKLNNEFYINLVFYILLFGILGARLYYILFNLDYYISNPLEIIKVWNGGLAIHGGIIAGIIVALVYCKKYNVNILKTLDIFSFGIIIGQIIGRWGNFFNQEAHGIVTSKAFLEGLYLPQFIIDGMYIDGSYYHPTFLYESIWNVIGLIIMFILRKRKYNKIGTLTGFYMIWYSVGRLFIEQLRTDSLMLGQVRVAQLISVVLIILGIILIIRSTRGSKFDNLYNKKDEKIKF